MSAIITLNHVNHWYDKGKENEVYALKDINLEIEQGDYVAFFGPSGCGKTTLLYATSGIDRVTSGEVLVKGRDISKFSNQELAIFRQTGIGIVFQQFNLVPSLTVLENIALPMAFVGITKRKAEEEAQKLVIRLGLEKYAAHYPTELSGGQQQRVGIARALANNPPILIADEPLGNLDSVNAKNVLAILKELNEKDGRTIIMVTHEAWSLQDVKTVFNMKDGAVVSVEHRVVATPGVGIKAGSAINIAEQLKKETGKAEAIEMMIRILSNFFMRGHSFEETRRFEDFLKQRFERKIDTLQFQSLLESGFAESGVGLWKKKAERISAYIETLIEKQSDLTATIDLINKNPELPVSEEVRQLRGWVLGEYVGEISPYKAEILDELIGSRIRRFISAPQFLELLHMPVKDFGAGFPLPSAQKIAERLEIVVDGAESYAPTV
jgi:putative ABC transport system ATP-binding protein